MILTFFFAEINQKKDQRNFAMLAMFSRFFFSLAVVVGASNAVDDWSWTHFPGIKLDAKCQIS